MWHGRAGRGEQPVRRVACCGKEEPGAAGGSAHRPRRLTQERRDLPVLDRLELGHPVTARRHI